MVAMLVSLTYSLKVVQSVRFMIKYMYSTKYGFWGYVALGYVLLYFDYSKKY
jgi:hypothetical protein